MPVHPQAQVWLDQLNTANLPEWDDSFSPDDARRQMAATTFALGAQSQTTVAKKEDRTIPGPAGKIPIRVYTPEGDGPFPIVVYFHGGGWVVGGLDSHDGVGRNVANRAGCIVISVDYRLAPEQKYPAAVEDAYAAVCWAAEHGRELGGDPARLAVLGDSAGGNLSAVVALLARERGGPKIALQVLMYPVTDYSFDTDSYRRFEQGYFLTKNKMAWYWGHYLPNEAAGREPYASPLRAESLEGLPPALVITAEYDPLRSEGEAFAERLREAGVPVTYTCYTGALHGFFNRPDFDQCWEAVDETANALKAAFAK